LFLKIALQLFIIFATDLSTSWDNIIKLYFVKFTLMNGVPDTMFTTLHSLHN
jgi:hypothetical protein